MGDDSSDPAFNAFSNLSVFSVMDNPYASGFSFTFSDFKLRKKESLSFKKSGIKERTYEMRDDSELESV